MGMVVEDDISVCIEERHNAITYYVNILGISIGRAEYPL
jgi:hypothetical protein